MCVPNMYIYKEIRYLCIDVYHQQQNKWYPQIFLLAHGQVNTFDGPFYFAVDGKYIYHIYIIHHMFHNQNNLVKWLQDMYAEIK